jgi:hypothetical protein
VTLVHQVVQLVRPPRFPVHTRQRIQFHRQFPAHPPFPAQSLVQELIRRLLHIPRALHKPIPSARQLLQVRQILLPIHTRQRIQSLQQDHKLLQ